MAELHHPDPPLTDGVVLLRRARESDVPAIVEACQDPGMHRYMSFIEGTYTEADAHKWLSTHTEDMADGLPVVPVGISAVEDDALVLDAPPGLAPPGGRRAGLTAHWFSRHVVGQRQQVHTGWLDVHDGVARYAPHTRRAYWMPPLRAIHNVAVGFETRRRARAQ